VLPKKFKLSIKEFPKRSTVCFEGEEVSLKKSPNKLDYARFGVMTSKKVSSKATIRNWAKRTVYDFLSTHLGKIPGGLDLLVVVGAPIMKTDLDTKNSLLKELEEGIKTLAK